MQLFGITLENKLSEIESKAMEGKGKNQAKTAQRRKKSELQKWLNSRNPEATPRGIYRDPANA